MQDATRQPATKPADPELEKVRNVAGAFSLGIGVVALPVSLVLYALFAYLTVTLSTACVGASSWICAVGPMVLSPLAAVLALIALVGMVVSFGSLLFSGATLVRNRVVFFGATLSIAGALTAVGLGSVAVYLTLPPAGSVDSAALGAHLVAVAIGAPAFACAVACIVAAAFRGLKVGMEQIAR